MPFIDTSELKTIERLPGWKGKYFDSESMTFGHYVFEAGSSIHEHSHANEEVWNVIEGQLEVRIDGKTQVAGPGCDRDRATGHASFCESNHWWARDCCGLSAASRDEQAT